MKVFSNIILNNIFVYLLYKKDFNVILEYSLISKASFSMIQDLLTYENGFLMTKMHFNSIKKYIEKAKLELPTNKPGDLLNTLMKRRLLQFKEIEQLNVYNEISLNQYNYLTSNFKNLKTIYSISSSLAYFPDYKNNKPMDDLKVCKIQIQKLYINWFYFGPISTIEEHKQFSNLKIEDAPYFSFTFEFLSKSNPKKLIISSPNDKIKNNFHKLNNILNFKSIKSIKFQKVTTPNCFITKKLVIRNSNFLNIRIKNLNDPSKFLNQITLKNYNLKYIGLEFFTITDSKQLDPLYSLAFLNTISCNKESFLAVIQHCNENKNIKRLKYHNQTPLQLKSEEIKEIYNFFKSNKTLEDFRIFYYYPHLEKSFLKIKQSFSDSKNKTIKNLEINEVGSKH
ncbi:hypothetical protein RB653_002425 [Dictyostelium firmibasis]|uniref:Uncharacterized protein n=1 Tax=Dictyostelium firmibasis TaxID=79012 RepID=A0AAN7TQN5_9MYCE